MNVCFFMYVGLRIHVHTNFVYVCHDMFDCRVCQRRPAICF